MLRPRRSDVFLLFRQRKRTDKGLLPLYTYRRNNFSRTACNKSLINCVYIGIFPVCADSDTADGEFIYVCFFNIRSRYNIDRTAYKHRLPRQSEESREISGGDNSYTRQDDLARKNCAKALLPRCKIHNVRQ